MNSSSGRNVGHQSPTSKSVSVPTPRELQPTPVLMQLSSTMVLRSHKREDRSSTEKPKIPAGPEIARQPEVVPDRRK